MASGSNRHRTRSNRPKGAATAASRATDVSAIAAHLAGGRYRDAEAASRDVLERQPADAAALTGLAIALLRLGRAAEAADPLRKAIAAAPSADRLNLLGEALRTCGQLDAACAVFREAIACYPASPQAYANYADARHFGAREACIDAMERLLAAGTPDRDAAIALHFALGKALDDLADYDAAFAHFAEGNRLQRGCFDYDVALDERFMANIARAFDRRRCGATPPGGLLRRLLPGTATAPAGSPHRMIFVVGMPRSGSSLIEQILASHTQVAGVGEHNDFKDRVVLRMGECAGGGQFPEAVAAIDDACLAKCGDDYLAALAALAPGAARIVDKTPLNFLFVGLIHRLWPHARVIWSARDARDTCLSCFTRRFEGHQKFTYDLGELARYHKACDRLMRHWVRTVPAFVHEVRYEALVRDLEGESRRLLAFCGLEWEPACLAFHRTERDVRTASAVQVRQPLYDRSVGRWRCYERELAPLRNALATRD